MTEVFAKYADYYDLLYQDKDYERECDYLEYLWNRYSEIPVRSILNVGCGTGNHDIPLARRGYEVQGIDQSSRMIDRAREKAEERNVEVHFTNQDILHFNASRKYDAVISMFATLSYLTSNADLLTSIRNIRAAMKRGGLFISDVWYGPAVLTQKPETRVKKILLGGEVLYRIAEPRLESANNVVQVDYLILRSPLNAEVKESHRMRYFFLPELELMASEAGFQLRKALAFLSEDEPPSLTSWNVTCIFQAL